MIIDSHVHIKGGDYFRRQFDPDATVQMLDDACIDKACVFSISLPSWEANELTRNAVQGREDRLIPYAHVLPEEGDIAHEEFRRVVEERGFKGLKLHVGLVRGEPNADLFIPFLEQAAQMDVPVLLDCIHKPEMLQSLADSVPQAKIIAAHMGSFNDPFMVDKFINICGRKENVWLDTAYSSIPWKIRDAVHFCGANKVIFGSDGGAGYYPASIELAKVKAYNFTPEQLELILGGNIRTLIGV